MKNIATKYTTDSVVFFGCLLAYSVLIIGSFHYERLTGDATIYLSTAEKCLAGDFSNAINGYWGPLLSWLLIPFLAFGLSHVVAINSLNLIFGLLTIVGIWKLSFRFEISSSFRLFIIIPAVPILLFVSLIEPMDFLLLCVLVHYLYIIFSNDYTGKVSHAILTGFLGALAYFSKPYGFPFFISHFILMNICHYFRSPSDALKKKVLRNSIAGFLIFFTLSGVWIGLISYKYGHLTFSNQGSGVFRSLGPLSAHKTLEKGDPIFFDGFFAPPNETAVIIYEDPSHARKRGWNPFESKQSFAHYTRNISENIFEAVRIYESYSRLSIAIVVIYLLLICYEPVNILLSRGNLIYPFLTILFYTGGYMLVHLETRYIWIVNILLLLMGGNVLNVLYHNEFFSKPALRNILTAIFVLSFMMTPVKNSLSVGQNNINKKMHLLGTDLNNRYNIRGNIASNRLKIDTQMHDSWHYTFRLAYWLKSKYFGMPREGISDDELLEDLKKHDIDFYFFWGDPETAPEFLLRYKELTWGEIPKLHIYDLKSPII
jgi:hypothetical protein